VILRPLPILVGALAAGAVLLVALVLDDGEETPDEGGGSFGGVPVDPYASLEPEDACDPSAKPGVLLFRQWILGKFGEKPGSPQNIVRGCDIGGPSGHKQGRAWDLMTLSLEHGQKIVDFLTAPDPDTGEPDALARRAGLRYIIWDKQMWRAYPYEGRASGAWAPYTKGEAASPHTDHIHFSFSKAGADGLTSLYDRIKQEIPNA
jgi:hypothetical protein